MGLFERFPWTNFHELNLDWIMRHLRKVDDRLDGHDVRLDKLDADVATLDGRVDAHDIRLDKLDTDVATLDGRVDAHDVRLDKLDTDVSTLDGRADAHDARLDNLDSEVATLDERVDRHDTAIADLGVAVATLDARYGDLETAVNNLDNTVNGINGRLNVAEQIINDQGSAIDHLQGEVEALDGQVSSQTAQISDLSNEVTSLDGRVDAVETAVGNMGSEITALDGRVDALETAIEGLGRVDYIDAREFFGTDNQGRYYLSDNGDYYAGSSLMAPKFWETVNIITPSGTVQGHSCVLPKLLKRTKVAGAQYVEGQIRFMIRGGYYDLNSAISFVIPDGYTISNNLQGYRRDFKVMLPNNLLNGTVVPDPTNQGAIAFKMDRIASLITVNDDQTITVQDGKARVVIADGAFDMTTWGNITDIGEIVIIVNFVMEEV